MRSRSLFKGRRSQRGMSLLETVCTITIMGSVSATALPHVVDFSSDARKSVVMSMGGALASASTLLHVKCATSPGCDLAKGDSTVSLSDGPVQMWRGYPRGGHAQGIVQAMQFTGFTIRHEGERTWFHKDGAPEPARCGVSYASAPEQGAMPVIETDTSGC